MPKVKAGGAALAGAVRKGTSTGRVNLTKKVEESTRPRAGKKLSSEEKKRISNFMAVRKMNKGWFDDLSTNDIKELFEGIDRDSNGLLDFGEIECLLKDVMDPPCTDNEVDMLWDYTDQDDDNKVHAEELQAALYQGAIKEHFRQSQEMAKLQRDFATEEGLNINIDRDFLLDMLESQVASDDAYSTLPYSMLFFLVFSLLVTYHLNIQDRRWAATSMEMWVLGYGDTYPGPYFEANVADAATYFWWLDQSGLASVFGDCDQFTAGGGSWSNCYLANRNILLGDARMSQTFYGEAEKQSVWLLNSPPAQAILQSAPSDYLSASKAAVAHLWSSDWGGFEVEALHFEYATYNPASSCFLMTDVKVALDAFGGVHPTVVSQAVIIDPYSNAGVWVVDFVYLLMILYMLFNELKDLISGMRVAGVRAGWKDYWGFWNVMDWVGVGMAIYCIFTWVQICNAMGADSIVNIVAASGEKTVADIMETDMATLDRLDVDLRRINGLFFEMQVLMGLNCLTCVLRFFKAFKSNPRLEVVTKTLTTAAKDICHFSIVMITIFNAFALLANIWFGENIPAFASFNRSLNTCFTTLMGDLDWYTEITYGDIPLDNGMPRGMVVAWFWVFNILVLLIMLNMLMAIVLDHYVKLVNDMGSDAATIWGQTRTYYKRRKTFKHWVQLEEMLLKMHDHHHPAHPEKKVTEKSLMKGFEGVTKEQAEWVMLWLTDEAAARSTLGEADMQMAMVKGIEQQMETNANLMRYFALQAQLAEMHLNTASLPPWSLVKQDGTGGPYEVLHDHMEPEKMRNQWEALQAIDKVLLDLNLRLDSIVERTKPEHEFVAELTHAVESVNELANEVRELPPLPPSPNRRRPARLEPLPALREGSAWEGQEKAQPQPRQKPGKEVAGCTFGW